MRNGNLAVGGRAAERPALSWSERVWRRGRRMAALARSNPPGAMGGAIALLFVVVAVSAPLLAPYDPDQVRAIGLRPPSAQFLLGTDSMGRDMLSRVIWGSRLSLLVGVLATVFGQAVGIAGGLASGYWGGKTDLFIMRAVDLFLAFPSLIFAMIIVSLLGPSFINVVVAIVAVHGPRAIRVYRSQVLSLREMDYVLAAHAIGAGAPRILLRHLLPQLVPLLLVLASIELPGAIIIEASLSFLGLGVPPPAASWGRILAAEGRQFLEAGPWVALSAGGCLSLTVLGFNWFGDMLRDILDPRMRGGRRVAQR